MIANPTSAPARLAQGWFTTDAEWIAHRSGRAGVRSGSRCRLLRRSASPLRGRESAAILTQVENNLVFGLAKPISWRDLWSGLARSSRYGLGCARTRIARRGRSAWWLTLAPLPAPSVVLPTLGP